MGTDDRKRKQPQGLLEPYTVMIQERPVVVDAHDHEEAAKLATDRYKNDQEARRKADEANIEVTEDKNSGE